METGDTTVLMVLATGMGAQPQAVDFSSWADVFPAANILRRGEWQRSGAQWVRRFTLIAFDSANLELPALKVRLQDGKILETNVLKLSVFPTRASREIRDMAKIRDIRWEPESWLDYWPWGAGLLSALLLLVWWLRKNQHKPLPIVVQAVPEAPPPSASELALQKISQLQQKQLWKNGELKVHYAELSLIDRKSVV